MRATAAGFATAPAVPRAAPLRPAWAGGLALLAAGSLSSLAGLFTCASLCPIHAVVLHLMPALSIGLVGIGLGWVLLRRFR